MGITAQKWQKIFVFEASSYDYWISPLAGLVSTSSVCSSIWSILARIWTGVCNRKFEIFAEFGGVPILCMRPARSDFDGEFVKTNSFYAEFDVNLSSEIN